MKDGTLRARLDLPSDNLQRNLPIDVRDASLAFVAQIKQSDELKLPPGLYEVSAVLEDGRQHKRIVEVREGEDVTVRFQAARRDVASGMRSPVPSPGSQSSLAIDPDDAISGPKELLEVSGARLVERKTDGWVFEPASENLNEVPFVHLRMGDEERVISLPVNPCGPFMEVSACVLGFEKYSEGIEARAWIHAGRTVSSTMQYMVAEGQIFHAQSVASLTAEDMLREKYSGELEKMSRKEQRDFLIEKMTS